MAAAAVGRSDDDYTLLRGPEGVHSGRGTQGNARATAMAERPLSAQLNAIISNRPNCYYCWPLFQAQWVVVAAVDGECSWVLLSVNPSPSHVVV